MVARATAGCRPSTKSPGRVVELELALLAQLHDAGGGEALRMRGDAEAVARRERFAGVEIGGAEGALQHDLAAMRDRDDAARLLRGLHLEFEPARDVVERGGEPAVHGVPRSPDGAKRNPGSIAETAPGFASLHTGYKTSIAAVTGT